MELEQGSYWNALGYKGSPLFADPLDPRAAEQALFVGRASEIRNFLLAMSRRRGGLISVGGQPGSGKTSLVNRVQWLIETGQAASYANEARIGPVLPCTRAVQLDTGDDRVAIVRKCRDALRHALRTWCENGGRSKDALKPVMITTSSEEDMIEEIERVSTFVKELGLSGAIITIDNTELLEDDFLVRTLDLLRDQLLRLDGLWWVIIGREGLSGMIALRNTRLRGYALSIGDDISGLTANEFQSVIEHRHAALRTDASVLFPIPTEIYRLVYSTSRGDLRFTLSFLDSAMASYVSRFGRVPGGETKQWVAIAQSKVTEMLDSMRVDNPLLFAFVDRVLDLGVETLSIGDYKKFLVVEPEEMRLMLEQLAEMQLLWKERGAKYEFNYSPRGILEMDRRFRKLRPPKLGKRGQ